MFDQVLKALKPNKNNRNVRTARYDTQRVSTSGISERSLSRKHRPDYSLLIEVNGNGTHPLYRYLKAEKKGLLGSESIKWNFTKFLVSAEGTVLKRYAPTDTPEAIAKDVESLVVGAPSA